MAALKSLSQNQLASIGCAPAATTTAMEPSIDGSLAGGKVVVGSGDRLEVLACRWLHLATAAPAVASVGMHTIRDKSPGKLLSWLKLLP